MTPDLPKTSWSTLLWGEFSGHAMRLMRAPDESVLLVVREEGPAIDLMIAK